MIAAARRREEEASVWGAPSGAFGRLPGRWSVDRSIDGRALMQGTATLTATGDGALAYHEWGQITLVTGLFDAERRYGFRSLPAGFSVWFAEHPARLFHEIELVARGNALIGDAVHLCGEDRYCSQYVFRGDGTFTTIHAVTGPRKNYVLQTTYRRDSEPSSG